MLSVNFKFDSLEGDMAVSRDKDCSEEGVRPVRKWLKNVDRLDCFLGAILHDLRSVSAIRPPALPPLMPSRPQHA